MLSSKEFNTLYIVFEAKVYEHKVVEWSYFTDSSGKGKLVEIEYHDPKPLVNKFSSTILSFDGNSYTRVEQNRYYTICIKNAVRKAFKAYKNMEERRGGKLSQSIPQYFGKYFEDYPELFI
jgi:hypothetical protein